MALKYQTGEEIRKDDHVLISGQLGEIEFVVDPLITAPDTQWYLEAHGAGVMISEPKIFGSLFTSGDNDELEFVSRADN